MPEELEFRISSGLKDIIGKELITDDRIAIFELVKNAYDARAKKATISFQNIIKSEDNGKPPKILIIDNGDGMSYKDITDKYLFVGYSEKKPDIKEGEKDYRDKITERRRRHFAGSKGIGRFSCDRLGEKLKLYTKTSGESAIHTLEINWTEFEKDQEEQFETVKPTYDSQEVLEIEDIELPNFQHGTILEITNLNTNWDHKKLLRLKHYLQRLINPTQVDPKLGFKIHLEVKEFAEKDKEYEDKEEPWNLLNGQIENVVFEKLGMKTARVVTYISMDGKEITTELHDKEKRIYKIKEKNHYESLKNIHSIVFYLNSQAKFTFTRIMGIEPVNYGSILLYKNGIRVHPYGDIDRGDWLGLDRLKQQGWARYLGTREVIGRVEITGGQPGFTEVSSRDGGLVRNEHHDQLDKFMKEKVMAPLRRYVVEGIDWDRDEPDKTEIEIAEGSLEVVERLIGTVRDKEKEVDFNPEILNIFKEKESERLSEVIKNVEAIKKHVKDPEAKRYIDRQVKAIRKGTGAIKRRAKEAEKDLKAVQRKNLFLEKAVTQDKDVVMSLNHSIKITTFSIESSVEEANELIGRGEPIEMVAPIIDEIELENKKIQAYASYVSLANFDTRVETITEDLVTFVSEYLKNIVKKRKKKTRMEITGEDIEFKRTFKPLEVSIIIDNLVDNSSKAKATRIMTTFEKKKKKLVMRISDNGRGVGKGDAKHIFDRGFSSTDGSGTGLHHVKKLLKDMGADINYIGNGVKGHEKGACFEVTFK